MNYNYRHRTPVDSATLDNVIVCKKLTTASRLMVAAVLLCVTSIAASQSPDDHSVRFAAELDNIRALPFGFTAVCEQDDLKIRSETSATFIVRDSLLCSFRKTDIALERRAWFVLCSNNPELEIDSGNTPVAKCYELKFHATEI